MEQLPRSVEELDHETMVSYVLDLFHRTLIHYGLWFREAEYNLGWELGLELEDEVFQAALAIQMKRLAKILDFVVDERGVPEALKRLSRAQLDELAQAQAANWLAADGLWFQAVEKRRGMEQAKRLNDTCWVRFGPYEAGRVRRLLNLAPDCGLEGLKAALAMRAYGIINRQSIIDEGPGSFVFQMNDCRVQSTRKRRGLPDYPCRSAGVVEFPGFARGIDARIVTECIGCPPDAHPEEWFCAWRFRLPE